MPRGRKRNSKAVNPLVEHIADFSDMEYDDMDIDMVASHEAEKRDAEYEDETDRMWMYDESNEFLDKAPDESEEDENALWADEEKNKTTNTAQSSTVLPCGSNLDKYITSAVWFREMAERDAMTKEEKRYVELMIMELSQFYFGHLKEIKPSAKCMEAIRKMGADIQEAELCQKC